MSKKFKDLRSELDEAGITDVAKSFVKKGADAVKAGASKIDLGAGFKKVGDLYNKLPSDKNKIMDLDQFIKHYKSDDKPDKDKAPDFDLKKKPKPPVEEPSTKKSEQKRLPPPEQRKKLPAPEQRKRLPAPEQKKRLTGPPPQKRLPAPEPHKSLPSPAKKLPLLGKAGKSVGKALIKKVPVVGPALTAYDAYNSLKK